MIRSANKSADPELLGQDAWVARVEHNGWVELQVPKLGECLAQGLKGGGVGT